MESAPPLDQQLAAAVAAFEKAFDRRPTVAAIAPGRVNLIGEHTDYNGGFVLPMAIERQTVVVADRAEGRTCRVHATAFDHTASFPVEPTLEKGKPAWSNYIRGVVRGCLDHSLDPGGFDAVLDSNVPAGGGLSSSASIEVATATLIEALAGRSIDPVEKALLCQKAEHEFAGVPCGIMDQFISAMGQADHALLIDCKSHTPQPVPLTDPTLAVLIVNSNVKHELAGGEYAERRQQCETAAKAIGVDLLRDASMAQLESVKETIGEVCYRRARHILTEDQRTLTAVDAMKRGAWDAVGAAMFQSHHSLRDDFEVSTPELDTLVTIAGDIGHGGGVIGSRMTGGGFGGCTVSLVKADAVGTIADRMTREYEQATGVAPTIFVTRPAAGARSINL